MFVVNWRRCYTYALFQSDVSEGAQVKIPGKVVKIDVIFVGGFNFFCVFIAIMNGEH